MRTDRTLVCAPCRLRFARAAERCPTCGAEGLDLRDPGACARAVTLLEAAPRRRSEPMRALRAGWRVAGAGGQWLFRRLFERPVDKRLSRVFLVPAVLGGVAQFAAFLKLGIGAAVILGLLGMVSTLMFAVMFAATLYAMLFALVYLPIATLLAVLRGLELLVLRVIGRPSGPVPLQLAPLPPPRVDERVRGRVRCAAPTRSPGGVVCVAWRVVGQGPSGPIDDAGGVGFELDGADGAVLVEIAEGATIDVAVTGAAGSPQLPAISVGAGATSVCEGVIRVGDEVEVGGPCDVDTESAGYRGVTYRRRYHERPGGAPLVITPV